MTTRVVTVWTLTTDDDALVTEVCGSYDHAKESLREWAQYYFDELPETDDELCKLLADDGLTFKIEKHDVEVVL